MAIITIDRNENAYGNKRFSIAKAISELWSISCFDRYDSGLACEFKILWSRRIYIK